MSHQKPTRYIDCPRCEKGVVKNTAGGTLRCTTCQGDAVLEIPTSATLCPKCQGTGKHTVGYGNYCRKCQGVGYLTADGKWIEDPLIKEIQFPFPFK